MTVSLKFRLLGMRREIHLQTNFVGTFYVNLYEFPQENNFFGHQTWMHGGCVPSQHFGHSAIHIRRLSWLAHSLNFAGVSAECWESLARKTKGFENWVSCCSKISRHAWRNYSKVPPKMFLWVDDFLISTLCLQVMRFEKSRNYTIELSLK